MKNLITVAIAAWAIIATMGMLMYSQKYEQRELGFKYDEEAIDYVVNYVDSTADTGEMDDFVQSYSGQKFFSLISK